MFKELKIRNFQSHRKTNIKLTAGINVIQGENDSGKTAIMRAFRWLIFNLPRGEGYRSHWGGTTEVEADGVIRRRSGSENVYEVDGEVLKAMGTTLPTTVTDRHNIADINWQGQLDASFLLSETPGEVARKLNEMVNLDVIDATFKRLQTESRASASELKAVTQARNNIRDDLKPYEVLDELKHDEESLDATVSLIENYEDQIGSIEGKLGFIEHLDSEITTFDNVEAIAAQFADAEDLHFTIRDMFDKSEYMETLIEDTANVYEGLKVVKPVEDINFAYADLSSKVVNINKLSEEHQILATTSERFTRVDLALKSLKSVEALSRTCVKVESSTRAQIAVDAELSTLSNLCDLYKEVTTIMREQDTLIKDLTEQLPDSCPLCGGAL